MPKRQPPERRRSQARARRRAGSTTTGRSRSASPRKQLRDILSDVAAVTDPLHAETLAATFIGGLGPTGPFDAEAGEARIDAFIADVEHIGGLGALALCRAIASVGIEPSASAAASAAVRLRASGVEDPAWSMTVGHPRLVDAWASTDPLGDQTEVVGIFAYPDQRPHAIVTMSDHNFNGLTRNAMVVPDERVFRRIWDEEAGMPVRPLSAQGLADLWAEGLRWLDLYIDPPIDDDVPGVAPIVRSRMRLLPEPVEPVLEEVRPGLRRKLVSEFRRSEFARPVRRSASLARYFVDYKCDYLDGDPLRWSPIAVELCLTDWFPRKVSLEDDLIDRVPDVLRAFVRFCGERNGLTVELVTETLEAVDRFAPAYLDAMRDPNAAGPAKGLLRAMLAADVDVTDKHAVDAWILAFNAMPQADRERILGPSD